jgi:hypothetical protein
MTQIDGPSEPKTALLAGSGGVVVAVHGEREPYEALDDLMCVVEAFCPVWPDRGLSRSSGVFLL